MTRAFRIAATLVGLFVVAVATADDPEPMGPNSVAISGRVTDARTGEPIASGRILPAPIESGQRRGWQPHLIRPFSDGRFEFRSDRAWGETAFRIEAEGYRPFTTRGIARGRAAMLNVALQPDPGIDGQVVDAGGRPLAGARVALATTTLDVVVRDGRAEAGGGSRRLGRDVAITDADGRFRLPAESDRAVVVVTHEDGWARAEPIDLAAARRRGETTLRLEPWCRVEGRVLAGASPIAGRSVVASTMSPADNDAPELLWQSASTTDADGRFACQTLPSGTIVVDRAFPAGDESGGTVAVKGLAAVVDLSAGEMKRIILGGVGRPVIGRLEAPDDFGRKIDWTRVHVEISPTAPHIGLPGDDAIWKAFRAFLGSPEGGPYHHDGRPADADGAFRLDRLPQGTLRLRAWAPGDAVGRPEDSTTTFASAVVELIIPPASADGDDGDDVPIDLGIVKLRP